MLRKPLAVLAALMLSSGLASAQSAWTGGDDLPTNPLACDGTPGTVTGREDAGGVSLRSSGMDEAMSGREGAGWASGSAEPAGTRAG